VCYVFDFAPTRALRQLSDYGIGLSPGETNPETAVKDLVSYLPVLAYDGANMTVVDAGGILDIAIAGTSGNLLARKWESPLLVNVDNNTPRRILDSPEAMEVVERIEGWQTLGDNIIETIINKSEKVKALKDKGKTKELTAKGKKELTAAEKEYKSKRKEVHDKLIKFATRIPAFMYLTDFRENTLQDVITKLEFDLFKTVTGVAVEDFHLLVRLKVFNTEQMNQAVFAFRRYEDASLHYTGIESHKGISRYGLYDTVVDARPYINPTIKGEPHVVVRNDPSGSNWRKWDLHFHTPKSYDYGQKSKSARDVVERLIDNDISVVAVTDHHVIDAEFINAMQQAAGDQLTVLPGIEVSSSLGGSDGIHFIGIFPENAKIDYIANEISSQLGLSAMRERGSTEQQLYVTMPDAAAVIQKLGGLITVHALGKHHGSFENISNHLRFKMEMKKDLLRECVDILEVGHPRFEGQYREDVFPNIGFELPIIICSDDHWKAEYPKERCCWIKADPTFAGLKMALREPRHRFHIGPHPPSLERLHKNKTRYIKSLTFKRKPTMPASEHWFEGKVDLNPGLVAIIGNKGSGKSALADTIGLLASCVNSGSFSFLTPTRFCNPKTGRAQHIECTLEWHDGSPVVRTLNEVIAEDEPERVKYLPQSFVENICNDISEPGGGDFERELKKVVFSKVPEADQLKKSSLDELIAYRTQELQKEANALSLTLQALAERRAELEDKQLASVRSALEKQIAQVEEQIRSHQAGKPVPVEKPPGELSAESAQAIEQLKSQLKLVEDQIAAQNAALSQAQLRAARADKLLDKLQNLQSEFERRLVEINEDATELGVQSAQLVVLIINRNSIETIRNEALELRDGAKLNLDRAPDGLILTKSALENNLRAAQEQLDGPNKAYQAYLKQQVEWETTLNQLQGSANQPNSLGGLKAQLKSLDDVPKLIQDVDERLFATARDIHAIRLKEAKVLRELYRPVQELVDGHSLAKEQLSIGFEVELVQEAFVENLLAHINQQRTGSFSGSNEGRLYAANMVAPVDWEAWESVLAFLKKVVDSLHKDERPGCGGSVSAISQIGKGKTLADLYAWLFALSYVKPRYALKSDGKRMEQLSPGERGTLLLIFYLLVDDSDVPLIIDQPEANLDNATVAKKLVACVSYARERRQVIIVTHNPNLAVVCDADQIVHASLDIKDGHRITYKTGGLEHPELNQFTLDVLEGGRKPFDMRDETYTVCEKLGK